MLHLSVSNDLRILRKNKMGKMRGIISKLYNKFVVYTTLDI
jgi:hypothetical protein